MQNDQDANGKQSRSWTIRGCCSCFWISWATTQWINVTYSLEVQDGQTKWLVAIRMIHVKYSRSRSYQWAKFGRLGFPGHLLYSHMIVSQKEYTIHRVGAKTRQPTSMLIMLKTERQELSFLNHTWIYWIYFRS